MSERSLSQSEDPLPIPGEYLHRYNKEPVGTLGEVVVTDPRDPFVWLTTEVAQVHEMPTSNGKQLLWFIYRMNGNMPQKEGDIKWRDDRDDIDSILKNLTRTDIVAADRYIAHLVRLDAEEAIKMEHVNSHPLSDSQENQTDPIKLHRPNSGLVLAAIMQHLELIDPPALDHRG